MFGCGDQLIWISDLEKSNIDQNEAERFLQQRLLSGRGGVRGWGIRFGGNGRGGGGGRGGNFELFPDSPGFENQDSMSS